MILMRLVCVSFLLFVSFLHSGEVRYATPADDGHLLGTLKAGDTQLLAAGVYECGLPVSDCHGTPEAWTTIQGPDEGEAEIRQSFEGVRERHWVHG